MELDTNHDGLLDLLRVFNEKGELESEEADRNYDGKSDVWVTYENGAMTKQAFDNTFSRGVPDETDYYRDGKLKRIERDRNGDGKTDVWEFYVNGRLERMGVDLDFSGRVSVWYRDEIARAEQKKIASASAASAAASASAAPSASGKRKEAL
jgi:antitoxin component YwqK of YwqJK toxin-antitoxin module